MSQVSDLELSELRAVARRVALRTGLGDAHSDDVAQRTLLALLESPTPVHSRSAWVYTVARRTSYRMILTQKATTDAIPDVPTAAVDSEERIDVRRMCARLSRPNSELLLRRALGGMSIAEIARDTGLSPSTVKRRLATVRRRLIRAHG